MELKLNLKDEDFLKEARKIMIGVAKTITRDDFDNIYRDVLATKIKNDVSREKINVMVDDIVKIEINKALSDSYSHSARVTNTKDYIRQMIKDEIAKVVREQLGLVLGGKTNELG